MNSSPEIKSLEGTAKALEDARKEGRRSSTVTGSLTSCTSGTYVISRRAKKLATS